ncbi:hypothetical protein [Helicobacter sp. MIT 14-3879]|uniref:hypothetical protein n=1 Tax=Helicobacter sp. MIT 14-3879 TaxID=2040649 RepID=UPI000E1F637F|nr:hypothetical protein [Helicobacter sp. MIT 14-3879]RDU62646.1 hypothetical protein CQA44_06575 [Helicobacter sp. MIT 14-3879]
MIGIYILSFGVFLFIADSIFKNNLKYIFVVILFTISCCSIIKVLWDYYSLNLLIFSLFDKPSLLCVFLVLSYIFKNIFKNIPLKNKILKLFIDSTINQFFFLLLFIFGLVLFLGSLGLIPFDIYHSSKLYQSIFVFIFMICFYFVDRFCSFIVLLALIFGIFLNDDILTCLICVYLFVFSFIIILFNVLKFIINALKGLSL